MILLAATFFITALLYASVGFGGGSTYTALLAMAAVDFRLFPVISLICNVIVVTGGSIRFARAGLVPWQRVIPLIALSVPLAYLGGRTPIKQTEFLLVLGVSLLIAGGLLLTQRERAILPMTRTASPAVDAFLGGVVGYLSGLVGIGGGIFLSPIQHITRWGSSREIAATASIFILANSLSGLAGQVAKLGTGGLAGLSAWWPLFAAVFIGGQIGSHMGIGLFSERLVRRATGILIIYIAISLLWKTLAG